MKILVVVDMQNDFVNGSLGSGEAERIVPLVAEKIRHVQAADGTVLFTMDTHDASYLETQEGQRLPVAHCIKGTNGWELHPAIQNACEGVPRFYGKGTFGSVTLAEELSCMAPESVELVGLCTDICVISNAFLLKAYLPNVPIIVDASCCAGVTPESHRNALAAMKACQIEIHNEGNPA